VPETRCRRARVTAGDRYGRLDGMIGFGFALIAAVDVAAVLFDEQQSFLDEMACDVVRLGQEVIDDGVHTAYLKQLAQRPVPRVPTSSSSARHRHPRSRRLVDELRACWPARPPPPRRGDDHGTGPRRPIRRIWAVSTLPRTQPASGDHALTVATTEAA
jgi:hypothetical protein